jgi:hypothetical protein
LSIFGGPRLLHTWQRGDQATFAAFRVHYVIYAPDNTVTAISIFDDYAGAEGSTAHWTSHHGCRGLRQAA